MVEEKADALFLIMGGNPFPNLISVATRIKKGGKIVCVCTKETESHLYSRFRRLVRDKMDGNIGIEKLVINESNRKRIEEEIQRKLKTLLSMEDEINLLELNYTGGTKLISTVAYHVIKNYDYSEYNKNLNISLTYIDSERELLYFECSKGANKNYISDHVSLSQLDSNFDLNIKDIISAYGNINSMEDFDKKETIPKAKELANKLGNLFCDIGKKQYDERIKFIKENTATKSWANDKKQFRNNLSRAFIDCNIFSNDDEANLLLGSDDVKIFEYFAGTKWLEEYILNIFIELKEEGIVEDVLSSVEKTEVDEEQGVFEVDLVAYRKYKLFAISVTSFSTQEEAKGKLYEIRQRAKNLAGDEAGICYINLCWETDELKREYRNIWDDETLENTLILGAQDFSNLKNKLSEWLMGGE